MITTMPSRTSEDRRIPDQSTSPFRWSGRFKPSLSIVACLLIAIGAPRSVSAAHPEHGSDGAQPERRRPVTPHMRITTPHYDFGVVGPDSNLEHTFEILNAGDFTLQILRAEPTYGCALVGEMPLDIEPQQTGRLTFKLDAAALHGTFEKQIVVRTSDPNNATAVFTLRGELRRPIEVSPPSAGFGRVLHNEYRERIITITHSADTPVSISMDPADESASFVFHLVETIKGREHKLYVNTRPPYETGPIRATATLRTNLPAQPTIEIPAYGVVPSRIEVSPPTIAIRALSGEGNGATAGITQALQVNNHSTEPIRVVEASCSDAGVKTSVFEINPGRRYRVLVELPANYRPPQSGAWVTLKTDDEHTPAIEVPIGGSPQRTASSPQQQRTAATGAPSSPSSPAPAGHSATNPPTPQRTVPAMELVGTPAPKMSISTLDGAPVGNEEFGYHPATVLNFFAPNCGFSKKQIPKVEQLRGEYETLGVRFVNVCETMRKAFTPDEVRLVMAELNSNIELAMDPGNRIGRLFRVSGYPLLVVVGEDGRIDHVVSGNKANLVETVGERLRALVHRQSKGAPRMDAPTQEPSINAQPEK